MKKKLNERGIIKNIILVIIGLVLVKYIFDIDLIGLLTTGQAKIWLDKLYELARQGSTKYGELALKMWDYLIELIKNLFGKIK